MTFGEKLTDGKFATIATGSRTHANGEVDKGEYLVIANPETPGEIIETIIANMGKYDDIKFEELKTKFAIFKIEKTVIK